MKRSFKTNYPKEPTALVPLQFPYPSGENPSKLQVPPPHSPLLSILAKSLSLEQCVARQCRASMPPPPLLPLAYFLLLLPGELLERLLWGVGVSVRGSRCANSSRFIERELALESISVQIIPPALPQEHWQGQQTHKSLHIRSVMFGFQLRTAPKIHLKRFFLSFENFKTLETLLPHADTSPNNKVLSSAKHD